MCGICGMAATTPGGAGCDPRALARMRDSLRHRGPDDAGDWTSDDARVALAQQRLAIIDLSPGGHQPMSDETGELTVTFNGEIYNYVELREQLRARGHQFRSGSDTEVLLAAYREWGLDAPTHFVGMFAFALYDARAQRLVLARDRAGEKPLFYHHADGRLTFGSELKALLEDRSLPRRIDAEALDHYLAYGYVPAPRCLLAGFRKLPPGHLLTYDLASDELRTWPYWQPPAPVDGGASADPEVLVDELEELLAEAVRLQLRADVPVGVLLSGGVDSSLVTAFAAATSSKPVLTFTVTFPGHGRFDESPYARLVASHFGTRHMELVAEPSTVELLPALARQYDEPIADSSMIPTYLVSRAIREHATVALGGDGGDELFGGYPHHSWVQQHERWRRWVGPAARVAALARLLPPGTRGRNYLLGLAGGPSWSIAHTNLYFDAAQRRALAPVLRASHGAPSPESHKAALALVGSTPLRRATVVDFLTYLPEDILTKVDRASMLASLEVRAPLLDHRVIEFAFRSVPDALRATHGERKVLLRMLGRRHLPPTLDLRRKQGFSLPLQQWFRGAFGEFVADVLHGSPAELLDRSAVDRLLDQQRRGLHNTQRLFSLTMLELWRREYGVAPA